MQKVDHSPLLSDISHGFLGCRGGVSNGIYQSLNCGPGSGDDPTCVAENRRIAADTISGRRDTPILSCYQIHSSKVVVATGDWGDDRPKADGIVTSQPGLILGILTADCTPVLFADKTASIIGAAHAGWKGAFGGILQNTISAMESLGASRRNIVAAVGPTIHQPSYEVSLEFKNNFISAETSYGRFFQPGIDRNHFQFDLPGFVVEQLNMCKLAGIWNVGIDTYTSDDHFSYRRTTHRKEPDYGRQLAAIMLRGE